MTSPSLATAPLQVLNRTQYAPGSAGGMYESFYQRGNHPTRPLAFWIRYTLFSPKGRPDEAIGELWAVFFDGETGEHVVVKEEHPLATCAFDRDGFGARIAGSTLGASRLKGSAHSRGEEIAWDLSYDGDAPPLFLLPQRMYRTPVPKAKSLVGLPLATYRGELVVNGVRVDVDGWVGSQNHNWGTRHTDHYAFAQVAGFENAPDTFLEGVSARVRLGPVQSPMLTFLVLRHAGREHALVSLREALRARAQFGYFYWEATAESDDVRLDLRVSASPSAFVGLNYYNPPGGIKHCLNTKIAACWVTLTDKQTGREEQLVTEHRALFEILTDDRGHGVPIRA